VARWFFRSIILCMKMSARRPGTGKYLWLSSAGIALSFFFLLRDESLLRVPLPSSGARLCGEGAACSGFDDRLPVACRSCCWSFLTKPANNIIISSTIRIINVWLLPHAQKVNSQPHAMKIQEKQHTHRYHPRKMLS